MNYFDDSHFESEENFCGSLQCQKPDEHCAASGIPLKYENGKIFTDISDNHTLILGNTGSKKTRNFCLPTIYTLAAAGESMVIADPKGELHHYSSGYLKEQGYQIFVVNYRQPELGNYWNPLSLPYSYYKQGKQDLAVEQVLDLAQQLKKQVHSQKDPYWEQTAADLFIALTLIIFKTAPDESVVHLGSIQRLRDNIRVYDKDDEESEAFWKFLEEFKKDRMINGRLRSIFALKTVDKTLGCVLSVFDTFFQNLCFNDILLSMMSRTDFTYEDIYSSKSAVFIIMPDEKRTFHFLVSVFIKQCYEYFIFKAQTMKNGALPIRVNYVLDEFSNLAQIADMSSMISAGRSRNIRFFLFVQSLQQLYSMYQDDAETIRSNCQNWVFLASRENKLLEEVSNLCGSLYIEGRGYRPLLGVMALQNLEIGWEDSEVLVMRNHCYPYLSWIKDFSVYPQAEFQPVELKAHETEKLWFYSYANYMVKVLKERLNSSK